MLKRMNHAHLISLLATYQYGPKFHLMFPWAECDLRTYWDAKNPNPSHDINTLLWMARQCEGIAEGLDRIHHHETNSMSSIIVGDSKNMRSSPRTPISPISPGLSSRFPMRSPVPWTPTSPGPSNWGPSRFGGVVKTRTSRIVFGRHGDIKPTNLLWFPDSVDSTGMGTIKICDFGAGEFSTNVSSPSAASSISHSPPYRPPEFDQQDSMINNSYDVWTLGCLYLEFITWFMGGSELLLEFEAGRRQSSRGWCRTNAFFESLRDPDSTEDTQPEGARVKPAVLEVSQRSVSVIVLTDYQVYPNTAPSPEILYLF
jgi:serine/threonine protein kinase